MRMEFKSVQEGKVHIACTEEDCRDLIALIEGVRDSDFDMHTYVGKRLEEIEQALIALRKGVQEGGEIILSKKEVSTISAIISFYKNYDSKTSEILAQISPDRLGVFSSGMEAICRETFPGTRDGPY